MSLPQFKRLWGRKRRVNGHMMHEVIGTSNIQTNNKEIKNSHETCFILLF